MADPASLTLTQLRECLANVGIVVDDDFVALSIGEDKVTVERLERSTAGMTCPRTDGGVRTVTATIPVVAEPPAEPPPPEG